jgi:hypothetical protein
MGIHRTVTASAFLALLLSSSLALAQDRPAKQDDASTEHKQGAKRDKKSGAAKTDDKSDKKQESGAKSDTRASDTRTDEKTTDSDHALKQPESTTIAGEKAVNKDEDLDMAVGKTVTTAAAPPGTRDVIESRAEERREGEGRRVTVAPLAGYGFNGLGFGAGVRGGYTFDYPIYVGGTFMYHAGSEDNPVSGPGIVASNSRLFYPGIEAGYDVGIGPVLVRPYVGTGILFGRLSTTDINGVGTSQTETALMFYPGVNAHYIIARSPVFVGGDARVLLPLQNQGVSLNLLATAGLHL